MFLVQRNKFRRINFREPFCLIFEFGIKNVFFLFLLNRYGILTSHVVQMQWKLCNYCVIPELTRQTPCHSHIVSSAASPTHCNTFIISSQSLFSCTTSQNYLPPASMEAPIKHYCIYKCCRVSLSIMYSLNDFISPHTTHNLAPSTRLYSL